MMGTARRRSQPGRAHAGIWLQGWTFLPKHIFLFQLEILLPGRSMLRNGHGGASAVLGGAELRIYFLGPALCRVQCWSQASGGGHSLRQGARALAVGGTPGRHPAPGTGAWAALRELSSLVPVHPTGRAMEPSPCPFCPGCWDAQ